MADGTTKPCSKIRKGDMVDTTRGPAVMRCVIKTPCTKVNIVEYQGLRVTQWHPVINGEWPVIDGVWSFPIYLGETKEILDVDIFSFLQTYNMASAVLMKGGLDTGFTAHGHL